MLYRGGERNEPVVFHWRRRGGRVWVLPAELLANGRLLEAGNGDLLASLRAWLGPRWTFDEFHHGWEDPEALPERSYFGWDLFIAHLALIYLLGLLALGRPFGPPWREAPAVMGSTGSFLKNLGALHHKLGHHGEAARLLVERWHALFGGQTPPEREEVTKGAELVALAREMAGPDRQRKFSTTRRTK